MCSASGSSVPETELVNEVLEYIPRHEEDYLDVTLEEESQLIALMKSYLERSSAHSCWRAAHCCFLRSCEVSLACKVSTSIISRTLSLHQHLDRTQSLKPFWKYLFWFHHIIFLLEFYKNVLQRKKVQKCKKKKVFDSADWNRYPYFWTQHCSLKDFVFVGFITDFMQYIRVWVVKCMIQSTFSLILPCTLYI